MADNTAKSTRRRTSTPRSKKGCITCKIRRLKCGEEKPGCLRCAKSGWTCDGYEHVTEGSSPGPSSTGGGLAPILPHPHRSSSTRSARSSFSARSVGSRSRSPSVVGLSRTPTSGLQIPPQLHRQEQLYFQVFLDEEPVTFLRLDPFFWRSVAVQQSQTTSCIRHALVALGALIKSCRRTPSGNYLLDFQEGVHRQFAMQQHEKAIRGLREAISGQDTGDTTGSIAIACLVLARLEPFIGNGGFTMQHIRYARKLIFGVEGNEVRIPSIFSDYTDRNDVSIMMFFQSDMQALAAFGPDEDRSLVQTSVEIHNTSISAPTSFKDIEEAKQYQGVLIQGAFRFWYRSSLTHCDFWGTVAQNTVDIRDYFLSQIHHFHSALESLGSDPAESHGHPLQRPSSIKLSSVTAYLKLSLSLDAPETNADLLFSYFQYIVTLCQEVVDYENQYEFNAGYETFSFESRILGPLFIVALKCRDGSLRRQAISMLLYSHRRELINDSVNLGNMANWIMGIEEEGMDTIGYIPEESRTWGHSMEMDLQRRSTVVKCRVGRKIPGQWVERTTEIPCNEILG